MVRVRFEGGAELAAALSGLSSRLSRKVLREALKDAAEPMRAQMSTLAPEGDTGHLKKHIAVSNARGQDEREVAIAVGPTKGAFYGSFQEFGTTRHGAQPFMRPAFDANVTKALDILRRSLWVELAARGVSRSRTSPAGVDDFGSSGGAGLGAGNYQPSARQK